MPTSLDQYIGVHAAALDVRGRRTELIANNLANADTPGYKARDIDFRQAMARA
ncbi:MAG TPA: flagellar basal body rod protein FlgB, partial [Steroidobacteraceae bacterium]|nr:flagellar basal body rod protein FlgB [Steroidobacteraceae bacterium]